MEIAVALALFATGGPVLIDSYRLGAGWADDAPQSGYFPSISGSCSASRASRRWRRWGAEWKRGDRLDVRPGHETYSTRVHAVEIPVLH
jgi:hypothetical protein